ncbi:hypothetical protein CAC42_7981 [Sphaceloma murrayae]|uniref:RNA polymerase Rpb4/RPC9 core domain-containing protein n=1 Tax=Sphaceloma murrayae TaxID=2082308 RepID=A0A2K1QL40_9PEZI|nr:hypothetical protein CAC42_7981 [Sphaceloma murrayae]
MASHQNGTATYNPPQTSRPKRAPTGDEEAGAVLRLGEFQDVPTLSLSEARLLISAVSATRKESKKKPVQTETLDQVVEYLDLFSRFKPQDKINQLEQLLSQTNLDKYEKSQLSNLCPADVEEARTLISSLTEDKISSEDLDNILNEMRDLRRFTT